MVVDQGEIMAISHDIEGFNSASGHTKSIQLQLRNGVEITVLESDSHYQWWVAYMARIPSIRSVILNDIRNNEFDPFVEDMPRTLYALFQSITGATGWRMELYGDGSGVIKDQDNILCQWGADFDGAIERIEELKKRKAVE
jgi:hypothetical protein